MAIDLTTGKLSGKMLRLALPVMAANLMQNMYNLMDMYWLGKLDTNAVEAVSVAGMAFPIMMFLTALATGFAVAGTALTSRCKGAGDHKGVRVYTGQMLILMPALALIAAGIPMLFLDTFLHMLGVPAEVFALARTYFSWLLPGLFFTFFTLAYQGVSYGIGDTIRPMLVQIVAVSANMLLDPFLIFGWGPFPALKTAGAAQASLLARMLGAVLSLFFILHRRQLRPRLAYLKPRRAELGDTWRVGWPSALTQSIQSFGIVFLQGFVNSFGTAVITAYAIGNRITGFFMMPSMGITSALATSTGQNLGAGRVDRARNGMRVGLLMTCLIMTVGGAIIYFFGAEVIRFFVHDQRVEEIGVRMFKVTAFSSFAFAVTNTFVGVFNGAGHTVGAMILALVRLWCLRIPMVYLFSGAMLSWAVFQGESAQRILTWIAAPLSAYPYDSLWWAMMIANFIAVFWAWAIYWRGTWAKVGRRAKKA